MGHGNTLLFGRSYSGDDLLVPKSCPCVDESSIFRLENTIRLFNMTRLYTLCERLARTRRSTLYGNLTGWAAMPPAPELLVETTLGKILAAPTTSPSPLLPRPAVLRKAIERLMASSWSATQFMGGFPMRTLPGPFSASSLARGCMEITGKSQNEIQ